MSQTDVFLLREAAEQQIANGALAQARISWNRICELEPGNTDHWLILSKIDEHLGFYSAAKNHLTYAKLLDKDDVDVWLQAADLHWKFRRFDDALADLYIALGISFCDYDNRYKAALWLQNLGKFEDSNRHLLYLLKTASEHGIERPVLLNLITNVLLLGPSSVSDEFNESTSEETILNQDELELISSEVKCFIHPGIGWQRFKKLWAGQPIANSLIEAALNSLTSAPALITKQYFDHAFQYYGLISTKSEWLNETASQSYLSIIEQMRNEPHQVISVLEIGCGQGLLGQQLKQADRNLFIAGVELANYLQYLEKNTSYDQLIAEELLGRYQGELFGDSRLIIISANYQHLADLDALMQTLFASIDINTTVCIEEESEVARHALAETCKQLLDDRPAVSIRNHHKLLIISSNSFELGLKFSKCITLDDQANDVIAARTALQNGDYNSAEEIADRYLSHFPTSPDLNYIKGFGAQHRKNYLEALKHFRRALHYDYGNESIWFQIGTVWQALGRHKSMFSAYKRCLRFQPQHRIVLLNTLGHFVHRADSENSFLQIQNLRHHYPLDDSVTQLCEQYLQQLNDHSLFIRYEELVNSKDWLIHSFNSALEQKYFPRCKRLMKQLKPLCDDMQYSLLDFNLMAKQGDCSAAEALLNDFIIKDSENLDHIKRLRALYLSAGDLEGAAENWRSSFYQIDSQDGDLLGGLFACNYYYHWSAEEIAQYHFDWGQRLSVHLKPGSTEINSPKKEKGDKVRVGYVSGDFKFHSVSLFLFNIYHHYDRDKFEVFSYSTVNVTDNMTTKLKFFGDHFRNISQLSDTQASEIIQRDKIDILVDLAGHTGHNRLTLFALKPAPIQVTYLGYANTTGLETIDYRITDAIADPVGGSDRLHSEKLVRLDSGFLSYSRQFSSPPILLSNKLNNKEAYSFVCCNNALKMNRRVIQLFAKILKQAPGTNLLIKSHNLDNDEIVKRFKTIFTSYGVPEESVHLMNALDIDDHQSVYNRTAIALDPSPYNGTTTTCDALWMGVPVLTLRGDRHSARVGASIMHRLGLDEWIAENDEEYVKKAVEMIQRDDELSSLKLQLRQKMLNSDLMRPTRVVRELESAYLNMLKQLGCESVTPNEIARST